MGLLAMNSINTDKIELRDLSDRDLLVLAVQKINSMCVLCEKHNGRLRELETWRWYFSGAIAVVAFVIGVFGVWVLGRLP